MAKREQVDLAKRTLRAHKAYQRWLQVDYPAELAMELIDLRNALSPAAATGLQALVQDAIHKGRFRRPPIVPHIWEADFSFTAIFGIVVPPEGGKQKQVRCGPALAPLLNKYLPPGAIGKADPTLALKRLLEDILPRADRIFTDHNGFKNLLKLNEYVMEKTVVYSVYALSKWMGVSGFPQGIYAWPPEGPPHTRIDYEPAALAAAPAASSFADAPAPLAAPS